MKSLYLPLFSVLTLLLLLPPCTCVRAQCDAPVASIDLEVNAVRARLATSGNLWNGAYEVTADEGSPNVNPVSAIFTGALWMGGRKPGGELFVRTPQFGIGQGNYGYQPGPLPVGISNPDTCANWDRFFVAKAEDVRLHVANFEEAEASGNLPLPVNQIPVSLLGWPATGNPHFQSANGFPLQGDNGGLAPFWDNDGDAIYDPTNGDYPLFYGDEATWFVFNTANLTGDGVNGQSPFQIDFRLPINERAEQLEILDLSGRVVAAVTPNNSDFTLNIAEHGLVPGSYFYRLYTVSNRLVTGKVIVRKE